MSLPIENTAKLADTLVEVVINVLETQAFMFGEACPKDELITEADTFSHANMEFSGPVCGTVGIEVPAEVCAELAANILGMDMDESIAPEDAIDALQELLNVICGQALTALYGSEPIFDLSIPRTEEGGCVDWEREVTSADTVGLLVDEEPFLVYMRLKEGGS
jgi:CheY-specific phosphatase CheX